MVEVIFSPSFDRALIRLSKPYRLASLDVERVVEQLEAGETPGNLVPDVGYDVDKVRVENRCANRGRQGGFRKTGREDITVAEIRALVEQVLAGNVPDNHDAPATNENAGKL